MLSRIISTQTKRSVGAMTQTRGFAKKKAAKKAPAAAAAVPKEIFGVHGRYATALFLSASKSGSLDKCEAEIAVSYNQQTRRKAITFSTHLLPTSLNTKKTVMQFVIDF